PHPPSTVVAYATLFRSVLRSSGILVAAGIHAEPLSLNLTDFVRMKQQLRAAHDTTPAAFQEAVGLLAQHEAALSQAATHRLPLRDRKSTRLNSSHVKNS